MIEILPLKDKEKEEELLQAIEKKEANARVLLMIDGDSPIGFVAVDILKDTLRMLKFVVYEQENISDMEKTFFLDTLMRSAASYGETNGADKLATINSEMNEFLKKRGFQTDNYHAFAPMSLIVHYE